MGRYCITCKHPKRREIDRALTVPGASFRKVGGTYGVSVGALYRHKHGCLENNLVRAAESRDVVAAGKLIGEVQSLVDKAIRIFEVARREGERRTALMALREARGSLELLGRLNGELGVPRHEPEEYRPMFIIPSGTTVNVGLTPPDRPREINITPEGERSKELPPGTPDGDES